MYFSVTNLLLKQNLKPQLSCMELSKNVHNFLHVYHDIKVGVYHEKKLPLLLIICPISCDNVCAALALELLMFLLLSAHS